MALARLCGACLGLLTFSGMILRGLAAEQAVEAVLWRALLGLGAGVAAGMAMAVIGAKIVGDNLPDPAGPTHDDDGADTETAAETVKTG